MISREVDFPPVWLAGFAFASAIVGYAVPVEVPYAREAGALMVALALAIMVAAALQMFLARTTVIPARDPRRLVSGGLFRFSRNPIYLADALLLTGLCVGWGAWVALPLVPLFMLLISWRFIADEESRLERLFGDDWLAYKARTRRWL